MHYKFVFTVMAALAVAAIGTAIVRESLLGQTSQPSEPPFVKKIREDEAKPRFAGEKLGIFIRPTINEQFAPEARTYEDVCGDLPTVARDWKDAGPLALNVQLPAKYKLQPDDLNTGVVGCGDKVIAARWFYDVPENGAVLLIIRSVFTDITENASTDRVRVAKIGGRDAVIIEPPTPEGHGSSAVIFPEPFGVTYIHGGFLSTADLMEVANSVAAATRR